MLTHVVLCCLVMAASTLALSLPSYLTPCVRKQANFSACAIKNGMAAKARILQGDRKYRFPNMDPFVIEELSLSTNAGPVDLQMSFRQLKTWGMPQVVIDLFDVDFEKKIIYTNLFFPVDVVTSEYEMNGKILVLPVTGKGMANITLVNLKYISEIDYTLTTRNGKEYMVMGAVRVKLDPDRVYFQFDNLFNGDKLLGDQINQVMNDNWKTLFEELGPSIAEGLGIAIRSLLVYPFERIPYTELFPLE